MPSSFLVSKLSAEGTKKRIYKLISEKNYNNINIGETIETTEEINKYAACFIENCIQMKKMMNMNKVIL